jgi:hypothetical protein
MPRYEHTRKKISNVVRGEDKKVPYNISSYSTTIYSNIPPSDSDIYVITQMGDRLDHLAYQFYGDVSLWWYIAKANNLKFMTVPTGTSLRIPGTTKYALGT